MPNKIVFHDFMKRDCVALKRKDYLPFVWRTKVPIPVARTVGKESGRGSIDPQVSQQQGIQI